MNTKFNEWFEQAAADSIYRRVAIADLTKQRTIMFCCAIVITICALAICLTPTRSPNSPILLCFSAILTWFGFFRVDSNRRVLKLIDQLYKKSDEKTTA